LAEKLRAGGAGIPAFYTTHRRRHPGGRGQGRSASLTASLRAWSGPWCRRVAGEGLEGGQDGNLRVPPHRAQLQPGGGHGRQGHASSRWKRSSSTGSLDPDDVHLPGIYVHRIVRNAHPRKRIEKRTITEKAGV